MNYIITLDLRSLVIMCFRSMKDIKKMINCFGKFRYNLHLNCFYIILFKAITGNIQKVMSVLNSLLLL